jgi:hypothetical protein
MFKASWQESLAEKVSPPSVSVIVPYDWKLMPPSVSVQVPGSEGVTGDFMQPAWIMVSRDIISIVKRNICR